jgi:drug/metabolite transporter (DMT)-like permease
MASFWILATLIASAAQTARNAMQSTLTASIGTIGAAQVRFLYGFPFSLLFLLGTVMVTGEAVPAADGVFLSYAVSGAVLQIVGTVLMLAAMRLRSFAVATAYLKTEPVLVALASVVVLGEHLDPQAWLAIVIATLGVLVLTWKKPAQGAEPQSGQWASALYGVGAGGCFALAAVLFRGGILHLGEAPFYVRATTMLCWSLGIQSLILAVYMLFFDRHAFIGSLRVWRHSLFAGFMGALASQFWFIGFSLSSAANVRTLALVEVVMAQIVSRGLFKQAVARRDLLGMALVVGGVGWLLILHH